MGVAPIRNALVRRERLNVWVCVVLALLILYNPFVSSRCAPDASSVDQLARNRATVGASELQHFSPVQEQTQRPDANLQEISEEIMLHAGAYEARPAERHIEFPQTAFVSRIWSRPPPSV